MTLLIGCKSSIARHWAWANYDVLWMLKKNVSIWGSSAAVIDYFNSEGFLFVSSATIANDVESNEKKHEVENSTWRWPPHQAKHPGPFWYNIEYRIQAGYLFII